MQTGPWIKCRCDTDSNSEKKNTLCCRIRTARSLLGLVAAYPCGFLIWMDFFIFYPCGSYLDGFLQKWPTPAVIIRALKCLVMLLSGWDFLCLTPDVIILAVVLQKNPVLLLFRPCAQSSSIEYKYKPLAGLVVLLAKPRTGFCDHKPATHNESRLHNERRGKNDHCFARSIMTLVEMLHVP